jgi:hypothetical protein
MHGLLNLLQLATVLAYSPACPPSGDPYKSQSEYVYGQSCDEPFRVAANTGRIACMQNRLCAPDNLWQMKASVAVQLSPVLLHPSARQIKANCSRASCMAVFYLILMPSPGRMAEFVLSFFSIHVIRADRPM